jgi:hypothetical protein
VTAEPQQLIQPKVFVSYRWSSPEHEDWVLGLASSLRHHGVNVMLDKWHLTEGQDTLAFMESMVSDPDVTKVLMICDRGYVERADAREGGVGTEAQIISGKVYESVDQQKFAAIVVELNDDGKPLLPLYMSTRLYFDMSSADAEATNFEKVVRWIFGKPFHAAPAIGQRPKYLDETYTPAAGAALSSERLRQSRIRGGAGTAKAAADVLRDVATSSRDLLLELVDKPDPDQIAYDAMRGTFPLLEDTYRAFIELVTSKDESAVDTIHSFFEALLLNWNYSPLGKTYSRWDNDVLHYFGHECLVGFVAIAMDARAFQLAAEVLSMPLYKPRDHDRTGEAASYTAFFAHLPSLDGRNQRLKLNRLSLHADILAEHHEHSLVPFTNFIEADFTLYVRALLAPKFRWYPISLVFLGHSFGSFPTYVRATSARFYDRLRPLLLGLGVDALRAQITDALTGTKPLQMDYREISVPKLMNLEALARDA